MRIVYMGTPEFARRPLERLYEDGHDIAGVFTQADKPRGRGMKVSFSPVKELAVSHDTPVYQPLTLKDGEASRIIKALNCDLIAVVAYGKLLPAEILGIPPHGCINIHGSLLPKYRGAAPIQHAILNGENETGVTSMYMAEEMDAGDILFVRKITIGEQETSADLYDKLSILGAELLSETVDAISSGTAVRIPQEHDKATFAPLLSKEMSPIDWKDRAAVIDRKVRALFPWPAATAEFDSQIIKIFKVETRESINGSKPGELISAGENGIEFACADGSVMIKELQAAGGRRLTAADYLRGRR